MGAILRIYRIYDFVIVSRKVLYILASTEVEPISI